jgi:hypothetical protein
LVEGGGKDLSREDGLYLGTDGGNTSASTDELNGVNLLEAEAGILENLQERSGYTVEDRGDEGFVLLSRQLGGSVDIVHK